MEQDLDLLVPPMSSHAHNTVYFVHSFSGRTDADALQSEQYLSASEVCHNDLTQHSLG